MRFWSVVVAALALSLVPLSAAAQILGPEFGVVPPESDPIHTSPIALAGAGPEQVLVYRNQTTSSVSSRFAVLTSAGAAIRTPDVALPLRAGALACRLGECALVSAERHSLIGTATTATDGMFVVRFRTDGTLIDTAPLVLAERVGSADSFSTPVLAATATGYLVMWTEYRNGAPGRVLLSAAVPSTGPAAATVMHDPFSSTVRLACSASVCLLLREQFVSGVGTTTTVQRLAATGVPVAPPVELTVDWNVTLLADTGVDFVVAQGSVSSPQRWRIGYDGTITPLASAPLGASRIACDGAGACLLLSSSLRWWRADDTIVVDSTATSGLLSANCHAPGTCVGLHASGGAGLRPITFDGTALTVGTAVPFAGTAARSHGAPLVAASDGAAHLVLFAEESPGWSLGAALVDDSGPLAGASEAARTLGSRAWVERGPVGYGLLTQRSSSLELHLLDDTGAPTFGPLAVETSVTAAAMAWNGTHYLVAWARSGELRAQRFDAIGQRVDDAPRVVRSGLFQNIDIAWDGAHWLVVTREGNVRVKAMRLEPDGTPIDTPTGVLVRDFEGRDARVSFGRGTYLAVWQDALADGSAQLRAARISTGGEVLDLGGRVVATTPRLISAIDVVFDGSRFVLGWSAVDDTSTTDPARIVVGARTMAIDGAMGRAVDVLDEVDRGYRSDRSGAPEPVLALSSAELGRTLITYTRQMPELAEAPLRVRARSFVDDSLGAGCASDAECASGACSDGICCDGACDGACEACGFDGVCGLAESGSICRDAAGVCDAPEVCDGSSAACPSATIEDCDGGVTEVVDAGTPGIDGGIETDGGVIEPDGSIADLDGGVVSPDAGSTSPPGGGCSTSGATSGAVNALLMLLALATRRRARR